MHIHSHQMNLSSVNPYSAAAEKAAAAQQAAARRKKLMKGVAESADTASSGNSPSGIPGTEVASSAAAFLVEKWAVPQIRL